MLALKIHWFFWVLIVVMGSIAAWTVGIWWYAKSIETPPYTVIQKYSGFEIRKYEPILVAQVEQKGNMQSSMNSGFGVLADYIFGNNTARESIAMTTPVIDASVSQPIAMTTPVIDSGTGENRTITFTLPSKWTKETLPMPNNPNVKIVEWPEETKAVRSFMLISLFDISTREKAKEKLLSELETEGIEHKGDISFAFYNPPLTPFFARRNEVMVTVVGE